MIPKIIHYCWFGRNPLPESALKCIASWRKFLPDYEIREWNEDNFDVSATAYTAEAYAVGKYAFVSDYARFWILYNFGGLYFDTDVEVIAPLDDIVNRGPFMGVEVPATAESLPLVNPGLGLGAYTRMPIYKDVLDYYAVLPYADENGQRLPGTVVTHNTAVLRRHGLKASNEVQCVSGVVIYPRDYFNPLDDATGRLMISDNTRTIHWYSKTWVDGYGPCRQAISRLAHRILGTDTPRKIYNLLLGKI